MLQNISKYHHLKSNNAKYCQILPDTFKSSFMRHPLLHHSGVFKGGVFSKVKVKSDHELDEPPKFQKCFGQLLTKYTKSF